MTDERIERVRVAIYDACHSPTPDRCDTHYADVEALRSLEHELTELREKNEWLNGKWETAADRCPQCGTGVKASPYVRGLERELTRLRRENELGQANSESLQQRLAAAERELTELREALKASFESEAKLAQEVDALSHHDEAQ